MKLIPWVKNNWRRITIAAVVNFIGAYINKFKSKVSLFDWRDDQFSWRAEQVAKVSPVCLAEGECIHCHCDIPDKFWEPDGCAHGCYPAWKDELDWEKFKENGYTEREQPDTTAN